MAILPERDHSIAHTLCDSHMKSLEGNHMCSINSD
jgi:hypothetical protein